MLAPQAPPVSQRGRDPLGARKPVQRPVQHHPDAAGDAGCCIELVALSWPWLANGVWSDANSMADCRAIVAAKAGPDASGACWAMIRERWSQFIFGFYPPELVVAPDPDLRPVVRRPRPGALRRQQIGDVETLRRGRRAHRALPDRRGWLLVPHRACHRSVCRPHRHRRDQTALAADRHPAVPVRRPLDALGRLDLGTDHRTAWASPSWSWSTALSPPNSGR